jgi:hypothetical protein
MFIIKKLVQDQDLIHQDHPVLLAQEVIQDQEVVAIVKVEGKGLGNLFILKI